MIIYGRVDQPSHRRDKKKGLDNDFETSNLPAKECLYVSVLGRD